MRQVTRAPLDIPLQSFIIAAGALIPPVACFCWLQAHPSYDLVFGSHTWHFVVVSCVAAMATILAFAVMRAARHLPDPRTFFLAMGFFAMAGVFLAHGLGTAPFLGDHQHDASSAPTVSAASPAGAGYDQPVSLSSNSSGYDDNDDGYGAAVPADHSQHLGHEGPAGANLAPSAEVVRIGLVGFSAQFSLLLSALFFALAVMDLGGRFCGLITRHWSACAMLVIAPVVAYGVIAVAFPTTLAWLPVASRPFTWTAAEIAWVCLAFAGWRFLQSYRLSLLPLQGFMALAMAFLIEAQWFMIEGPAWHISWWEYHFAMLAGFLGPVIALLLQFRTTGDLGAVVEALFLRETVTGIHDGDPRALRVLGAAVAAKDGYTSAHVDRVSQTAVAMGEHIGLAPSQLEILRWAGRLHDLGKIGVPDSILQKPGRLTDAEFREMQKHSARGWQAARKSGVLGQASAAIRGHHERWNGSGYPDGLAGDAIPLEARIIAVADVWDAVTSDRPYRPGMGHDEAVELIRRDSGVLFDPSCVEALFAVLPPIEIPTAQTA